jgi:hypothetical protein
VKNPQNKTKKNQKLTVVVVVGRRKYASLNFHELHRRLRVPSVFRENLADIKERKKPFAIP